MPADFADAARAAVPLGLVTVAALVSITRPFALVALVAGAAIGVRRRVPVQWALAAPIPVAVSLTWGLLTPPGADPAGADCTNLASPPAVWRATEAFMALGALVVLAIVLNARPAGIGWRWPRRSVVRLAAVGAVILGPIGLLLGALLARPFFGTFELDLGRPAFLLPALVFALANGVMEEATYRGALLNWTANMTGTWPALLGQAVVFGVAHGAGPDVAGSPLFLGLALGVGGFVAGWIALRTRSLLIPIPWH